MGRFFGKRPDLTTEIAGSIRTELLSGESVLAGVHVQRPGTNANAISGAASGAVVGALGTPPTIPGGDPEGTAEWRQEAERAGSDADSTAKAVWLILVITTKRVLLIRRSRLTGKPRGILAAWPVSRVAGIRVPRSGSSVHVDLEGASLQLELPVAHKFLPDVYRNLPKHLEDARAGGS